MELSSTTWALIAIISALGLIGVVAVDTISIVQHAEAGCERGNGLSHAFDPSKGHCFGHSP